MNDVLLTVSGRIPAGLEGQVARGERPQPDYAAMAQAFGADLLDYAAAEQQGGPVGRLLRRLGGRNLELAWAAFQQRGRYRVIFTDGEQVGLPLALLLGLSGGRQRPRHLMIAHLLSVGKKMILLDLLALHRWIDLFFVYATWQKQFIETRWGVPPDRVHFTPFMVDTDFFAPGRAAGSAPDLQLPRTPYPLICTAGLEFRDYATLIQAIDGLKVHVVIAAASPWSRRRPPRFAARLPENVTVRRFSQYELRQLYALSRFVVMPLFPVRFQAGVTTLLEAMAMGKAVICSRTPGQTDVVIENVTGRYVPPQDPAALRRAIVDLLEHPAEAAALGANALRHAREYLSLKAYVKRLAAFVRSEQPRPHTALEATQF